MSTLLGHVSLLFRKNCGFFINSIFLCQGAISLSHAVCTKYVLCSGANWTGMAQEEEFAPILSVDLDVIVPLDIV